MVRICSTICSLAMCFFFFSSRRRHTRLQGDWSSDVCSSDLDPEGRPYQQDALRDLAAELLELLRIFEEVDDLAELFLGLVDPGDVLEGDLVLLLGDQPRPRLSKRQGLGPAPLHLPHEEDPHADEQQ